MVIDIHAHFIPPNAMARIGENGTDYGVEIVHRNPDGPQLRFGKETPLGRPILEELRNMEDRKARIRESGIDQQVLSTWMDIVGYDLPAEQAARWSRMLNQCMAEVLSQETSPGAFLGTATVPLQDGARAADEIDFAVTECGLKGVMIGSNVNGRNLDETSLQPFWRAAERLQVPIIVHPYNILWPERLGKYFLTHLVGLPADTTIAAASMYFSGVLDRFPDLRVVLCHGGGFLPYQVGRLQRGREIREDIQKLTRHIARDALAWFYYDSLVFDPEVLEFLVSEAGPEHVLLGSDCPFGIGDPWPTHVIEKAHLSQENKEKILHQNASRLFNSATER